MSKACAWLLRSLMVSGLALSALFYAGEKAIADPAVSGQWALGPNFPYFPVHLHLLPSGKVMMWPGDGGVSGNDPRVWDPATGTITSLAQPGFDVFCSGHNFLPDGRLFVAGGHIQNGVGLPYASIYNPVANTWTRQPQMNLGRWYPTTQMLPNGDVVVVSGDVDTTTGSNPLPQVWQAITGTWRDLTNAQLKMPLYPYMFLAPNGKVFNAGPSVATRYLDTAGTGAWSSAGTHIYTANTRDYGSAVMYEPGKILSIGGGDPPTAVSETTDLNTRGQPKWHSVGSMNYPRRQMNATLLPDGQVLATGGTKGPGFNNTDAANSIFAAEMWSPSTKAWTVMASSANIPRLYHSIALLLPDGRVLSTGGNGYTQTEIYSPPYLFAGPRPSLTSAPAAIGKGQSFFVSTPDASTIDTVVWIKTGSVTHTTNMNQGIYRTTNMSRASNGITITAPNLTAVSSGHYMLFLMRGGVPSVARIVQLTPGTVNNPVPTLSSINPSSAALQGPAFTLTANGANFVASSKVRWNGSDRTTTYVSANQLTAAIPSTDIATAGTAQVTVFNPTPGGGTSAAQTFTISNQPNLASQGTIIARVTAPTGGGSKNLETLRDGVKPPVGSTDSTLQYDTYDGDNTSATDWIGYQFTTQKTFSKVVFQEGKNFWDGGWFTILNVQVLQSGTWVNVPSVTITPAYPGTNNNVNFETYTLQFPAITGNGIRLYGDPGGSADFISVGELEVY